MNTTRVTIDGAPVRRGPRGSISHLPSGSLRVGVYAGINPVTGREHYFRETVSAGSTALEEAEAACRRLLDRVRERRQPRTDVTVTDLVDRHLALLHATEPSRRSHRRMAGKHIHPLLGRLRITAVTPEILDTFYAELLRCRDHCHHPSLTTCADRCIPRRSVSCTTCSAAPTIGPCGGAGSTTAPPRTLSHHPSRT